MPPTETSFIKYLSIRIYDNEEISMIISVMITLNSDTLYLTLKEFLEKNFKCFFTNTIRKINAVKYAITKLMGEI